MLMTSPLVTQAEVTDIDLNSLVVRAIDSHPLVGSAISEQKATQEGISAAKRNLLPAPSISSAYSKGDDVVTQLSIRQPLWTGGRLTANVNQSIFDDKAAIENVFEKQNEVAKSTISAWQSYITAITMQRVYQENLGQLEEFEAMMQRRVAQGVSARIELELLTNRILQRQSDYQAAKEQERIATSRLEQLMGEPLAEGMAYSVPKLDTWVQKAKGQAVNYEKMVFDEASFRNATVVKQFFQAESAKQKMEADKAANYPTVYAQYARSYNHSTHDGDGKFSLGMNYEPGSGFSNLALARASQARVNSIIQSQEAARRTVMENIQTQYQKFASAKSKELSLIAATAGSQIVVDSYKRQFIAGRKSWLEVLNAVREHGDNQVELATTRANMLGAFYNLQVDLGVMPWQEFQFNRKPEPLFHPLDPVDKWLNNQQQVNLPESIKSTPKTLKNIPNHLRDLTDKLNLDKVPKKLKKMVD
ncbi:MAG: transporter [Pseudomonadales bacterium]|nr:MAG: transporter [Pseudomonadales bacterium]